MLLLLLVSRAEAGGGDGRVTLLCFAAGTARLLLTVVLALHRFHGDLSASELRLRSLKRQATAHQNTVLDDHGKREGEIARLRKELRVEAAKTEAIKRQAESQAELFERLIYENTSLKEQLQTLDRKVATSLKKDD